MNSSYSFTYIHIYYTCGHEAIRPVLSTRADTRQQCVDQRCQHCTDLRERRYAVVREVQEEREESEVRV